MVRDRLDQLRAEMKKRGIDAYIVPSSDFHGSEYVGEYFKVREYLSGFTGSAGTLVVLENSAALWTDGRYFLQAARQLADSGIELMKMGESGVKNIESYLADTLKEGAVIGFDGRTVSCSFANSLTKVVGEKGMTLYGEEDLAGYVWTDRPALSAEKVWRMDEALSEPRRLKLKKLREKLAQRKCDVLLLSGLEEIAWLLNLRGNDVESTPVFLSYMIITADKALLFADIEIFDADIRAELEGDGVKLLPYEEIENVLKAESTGKRVWADKESTNFRLMGCLAGAEYIEKKRNPVVFMKAVKSEEECNGMRWAHIKDGAACVKFIYWLKTNVGKEKITELSASEKLLAFRAEQDGFIEKSFESIVGYGPHGAIIHYAPNEATDCVVEPRGLLLVDSGGHYVDGTTDITRTIVVGELTEEEKHAFTLVLKGHLRLSAAKFKYGVGGGTLDYLAREPLWAEGLDYNHGTGHGVGFVLSVHEGPQRIHSKGDNIVVTMEPGMITSNEPGLYIEGKFGIRHENLLLCVENEKTDFGRFLSFENLTMVPYDLDGIDASMLTEEEKRLLNSYHRTVCETISPFLNDEERAWLEKVTRAV
ncbi:MAG: aminopeptidase P family protein [Eubacteriales bacterium]|nr:aminopeptidase P family protein [Eubacteriales bacterium]